ncbi:MAG: DUF4435 domain-containing protein [Methanomicrobiaceae archaeon]|nr:DUF4435 domain-containing protein [Methanomicrobiaceae archaeon]
MAKIGRRFGRTTNNYRLEDIWADPEEIGGTIQKMERNYPSLRKKIFIITEGPYDYEFYSRFFNPNLCEIRFANSRKNVITLITAILADMPEKAQDYIIGIVDRDFSFFEEKSNSGLKNLFMTDTHDIETMIISDEIIKKVLDYYAKISAGGAFQRNNLAVLREGSMLNRLIECARLIGLSLYVNEKYDLKMTFKHINCKKKNVFLDFTDPSSLKIDEEKLMELICKRNQTRFETFREKLSAELLENKNYFEYPMQICRGHDLMCVLLTDININYPLKTGEKVRSRDLERVFRDFYNEDEFFRTELFKEIECWAKDQNQKIKQPVFIRNIN